MNVCAIILAGGCGTRMGTDTPKQKIEILNTTVLARTISQFQKCDAISSVIVVSLDSELEFAKNESVPFSKVKKVVAGGKTRAESARNGFAAIDFPCDYVAVHDGARCLISVNDINALVKDAVEYGCATASHAVTDTLKKTDADGNVIGTVERSQLRAVQTPQVFRYDLYESALLRADVSDPSITDDNSLFEKIGIKVHFTETSRYNIKITYKEDLEFAKYLLEGGMEN